MVDKWLSLIRAWRTQARLRSVASYGKTRERIIVACAAMPKRKRLTLGELRSIAKELSKADLDVIQEVVVKEIQKEQHIYVFADRKALWCYLIGERLTAFRDLLKDGVNKFCSLYVGECSKGAERHMRLLLAWNSYSAMYAVSCMTADTSRKQWSKLTSGYPGVISDDCRSAVISSVF